MFVPLKLLEQEPPLEDMSDCYKALERHVLPRYKDEVTSNPHYTKQECFVVLSSYFQAGKLNPRLLPQQIEDATAQFMGAYFWIDRQDFDKLSVAMSTEPSVWFSYSLKRAAKDLVPLYINWFREGAFLAYLTGSLLLTNIIRFCKLRVYKRPKE